LGFWALELKYKRKFIGFTGLHIQPERFDFHLVLKSVDDLIQSFGIKVMQLKRHRLAYFLLFLF